MDIFYLTQLIYLYFLNRIGWGGSFNFGKWFTPLREALSAFVDKTQETVTGDVKLKLYKGNMINAGVWSDYSLYSEEIATFGESDYDQKDAQGFINLWGLPISVQAQVKAKNQK